jgi:transcriptional regulator with XRE-family HTH domain
MSMSKKQPEKLMDQLRRHVADCGKTLGQIARDTGIDTSALSRFVRGERGLSMESLDQLGEYLGLRIEADKPVKTQKGG